MGRHCSTQVQAAASTPASHSRVPDWCPSCPTPALQPPALTPGAVGGYPDAEFLTPQMGDLMELLAVVGI